MSKQELKQKGFTIIEVVLVLAIAALIFLMVFIALPALQRNQRDAARKQELQKVVSGITTWQSNHRGSNPDGGDAEDFAKYIDAKYEGGNIVLPNTTVEFVGSALDSGTGDASTDTIIVSPGSGCSDNEDEFGPPKTSRQAAAVVQMENGSAFFCQAS